MIHFSWPAITIWLVVIFFHELGHYLVAKKKDLSPKFGMTKIFKIPIPFIIFIQIDTEKATLRDQQDVVQGGFLGIPFLLLFLLIGDWKLVINNFGLLSFGSIFDFMSFMASEYIIRKHGNMLLADVKKL